MPTFFKRDTPSLPIEIGDRLRLRFDQPHRGYVEQTGLLQDVRNGALCIDVDPTCRPQRGSIVQVSSLCANADKVAFSSEILGRHRRQGQLPVLLVKVPTPSADQRRTAHRIDAALKAEARWEDEQHRQRQQTGVLTNLSGAGACLFTRELPKAERLHIDICAPDAFIEGWAARRAERMHRAPRAGAVCTDPLQAVRQTLFKEFENIECRIVESSVYKRDKRGPIHALALSYVAPRESCFRLVRFLERQSLQRGLEAPQSRAAA